MFPNQRGHPVFFVEAYLVCSGKSRPTLFLSLVSSLSLHDGLRSCRSVESPVRLAFDAIEEVEPEVKDKDIK